MALGLQKLSAGSGYEYLTRQVAALDATSRGRTPLADYYVAKGEAPGQWHGSGLDGVGLQHGDEVTAEQMKLLFGAGLHPVTGSRLGQRYSLFANEPTPFEVELGRLAASWSDAQGLAQSTPLPAGVAQQLRTQLAAEWFQSEFGRPPSGRPELHGFIARSTAKPRVAVAGYDLTFSPVKSVSALWALADRGLASEIRGAHDAAVRDALAFIEGRGLFTRRGHDGIRQVDTRGLIAALFVHRDSRAGDPDLHTHVAIANKVQALDGRWLAIDGRILYAARVGASEAYTTSLQARLSELGLRFEAVGRDGKRPVYEVVGVDPRLLARWSTRRDAIERQSATLASDFEASHGRPPTPAERIQLDQRATLETRLAKHEPRSEAEQRRAWRAEAEAVLGRRGLPLMLRDVVQPALPGLGVEPDDAWLDATASGVIATMESQQATWQEWHVRAEALRQVRAAGVPLSGVDAAVDALVERALGPERSVRIGCRRLLLEEPEVLRRRDGSSMYHVAGSTRFTSQRILDAEARLIASASLVGGRVADANSVGMALLQSLANGAALNAGQRSLVQELATSGRRVQVAIAPAGTGKTTAMSCLAAAWINAGGDVLGLAPSASAAEQLGRQLDGRPDAAGADTLAKLAWEIDAENRRAGAIADRIGPRTLVIVDEAGMADTLTLDRVVAFCLERGASVRLVGDDRQLSAVGAGGVVRDIAATHGAVRLDEAVRFASAAEAAASLALRSGDAGALGFCLDHGRVHVADAATASSQVLGAWLTDVRAGRDALMLAPTRALVANLNAAARRELLGAGADGGVVLADGNRASVGDVVLTRQNDRTLAAGETAWVRNGDRWTVVGVRPDGALDVESLRSRGRLTLPAWYVGAAVELGYATTIHGAQGVTADVCHGLVAGAETRHQLYTLLSRGRLENHAWVQAGTTDAHAAPIARDLVVAASATEVLERIIGQDDGAWSASSLVAAADEPAALLGQAVACYVDAIGVASERALTIEDAERIDFAGRLYGLVDCDAWPTLRTHLALCAADGRDPVQVVMDAVEAGPLTVARDRAAVSDHRLDVTDASAGSPGPLSWLPGIPSRLLEDPEWRDYLTKHFDLVGQLADEVRAGSLGGAGLYPGALGAGRRPDEEEMPWASGMLMPDALLAEVSVWRAAHGVPDSDQRPTGPVQHRAAEARVQHRLEAQIEAADPAGRAWTEAVRAIEPRLSGDPGLPKLGRHLAALATGRRDVQDLLLAAVRDPLPDGHAADAVRFRISDYAANGLPSRLWMTETASPSAPSGPDPEPEPRRRPMPANPRITR